MAASAQLLLARPLAADLRRPWEKRPGPARLGPQHHVLWKLPRSRQHLLPTGLPPNLRVESWIPSQLAVLAHPHVRVFFNHGGGNAIHEGLHFGKPQLVMPFFMDHPDNAARVVDSGTGLAVPHAHYADAGFIAAKLTRLLGEPGFRSSARRWSRQLRAAGGVAAAADEITGALDRLARVPDNQSHRCRSAAR